MKVKNKCDECEAEAEYYVEATAINLKSNDEKKEIVFCRQLCSWCKEQL